MNSDRFCLCIFFLSPSLRLFPLSSFPLLSSSFLPFSSTCLISTLSCHFFQPFYSTSSLIFTHFYRPFFIIPPSFPLSLLCYMSTSLSFLAQFLIFTSSFVLLPSFFLNFPYLYTLCLFTSFFLHFISLYSLLSSILHSYSFISLISTVFSPPANILPLPLLLSILFCPSSNILPLPLIFTFSYLPSILPPSFFIVTHLCVLPFFLLYFSFLYSSLSFSFLPA